MSAKKGDKINRLRKIHVWPTVVFTVFSLFMAFVAVCMFVTLMIVFLIEDRSADVFYNAQIISSSINIDGTTEDEILKDVPKTTRYTKTVIVVDKNGKIVAGTGSPTYKDVPLDDDFGAGILGKANDYDFLDSDFKYRLDTAYKGNLISENGDIVIDLLDPENIRKILNTDNKLDTALFEAVFWTERELSDDRTVLVQCAIPFYFKDFGEALAMGGIAFAMMLIPIVFLIINVVMSVHHQKHMTKLLYTDHVTEGSSMLYFEHTANKKIAKKKGKLYAIADVTVIKYRSFCNYHGAKAGEELLANIDKELNGYLGKSECCAHSGKSSFAVLLECSDKESGEQRVTMLVNDLSQMFRHGGIVFHAGVFFTDNLPGGEIDAADCFNRAGAARATLTDENTPSVAVYNDRLLEEQLWEHKVEVKMQAALDSEEFRVFVQPKYDPVTEKLAGGEALVRWINDEDGFISPGKFIPIFEKNGFITKLDDYMISHVAQLQAKWLAESKDVVPVSVNVSRAHFANPDLAEHISKLVDAYNVPHHLIEIELTESAFFDDKEALLKTVHKLGEMGFEISMDDFGAGYSSLNSLKDLPLNVLKLDAEFFRGEAADGDRGEIVVSQAINLAKKLDMRIVAEGVEKKEQVDFLAQQGCDMIQGFYFAKPMPADEYAKRLEGGVDLNAPKPSGQSAPAQPQEPRPIQKLGNVKPEPPEFVKEIMEREEKRKQELAQKKAEQSQDEAVPVQEVIQVLEVEMKPDDASPAEAVQSIEPVELPAEQTQDAPAENNAQDAPAPSDMQTPAQENPTDNQQ